MRELEAAWRETPELGLEQYEGTVTLLAAFAIQPCDDATKRHKIARETRALL